MADVTPKKKKSLLKRWFSVSDDAYNDKPKDKGKRKSLTSTPEQLPGKASNNHQQNQSQKSKTLPTIHTEDFDDTASGSGSTTKPIVKSTIVNSLKAPETMTKTASGSSLSKDGKRKRKGKKQLDVSKLQLKGPLTWPTTPETILAYHKLNQLKPMLKAEEEWMLMELNEYECLVESMDILKQMSKVSKFFEVDPDELWEEFFEFVEEIPAYDDMLTSDILQEFKDQCYPQ